MNSKILFLALAMTFGTTFVAHADGGYRRPAPIQQDDYDTPEEDLDEDYRRPSRGCEDPCERRERQRREYYCAQPQCQRPIEMRPFPYQQAPPPVWHPVPLPRPVVGNCTVVPNASGWTIFVNGTFPLVHGSRADSVNLPGLRQYYIQTGVCYVFLN